MSDGADDKWVGPWFTPKINKRYFIPKNAGNYMSKRGKAGFCIDLNQSGYGHVWATIAWDDNDLGVTLVRTCYLKPEDGEQDPLVEEFGRIEADESDVPHPDIEDVVHESILGGNTGAEQIRGA